MNTGLVTHAPPTHISSEDRTCCRHLFCADTAELLASWAHSPAHTDKHTHTHRALREGEERSSWLGAGNLCRHRHLCLSPGINPPGCSLFSGMASHLPGFETVFCLLIYFKEWARASLVVQWLRVRLPMQGTRVRAPVREDPTRRGAAGPVSHGR